MKKIVNLTETQLNGMVANKATFEKLHVGGKSSPFLSSRNRIVSDVLHVGLVKKNMGKTAAASSELAAVMLEKAPESIKKDSIELDARRKSAFDKATAAFADSKGGEDKADEVDDSD